MNADAARFQILDFEGTVPYTHEGVAVDLREVTEPSWRVLAPQARRAAQQWRGGQQLRDAVRRNSPRSINFEPPTGVLMQRFDVRRATCVGKGDKDALLAAIESCGAGFETFNEWMHNMLVTHCAPPPPDDRQMTHTHGERHLLDLALPEV